MYRPAPFVVDDVARLHATIRANPFATLARAEGGGVSFAYAPVALDAADGQKGSVRFHLARANPFAAKGEGPVFLSFRGPDAYISPDWYETKAMVPTWNYIAIEGQGAAQLLAEPELRTLLVDLSAAEEARLLPKAPWRIDKVPEAKLAALMNAIVGFRVVFEGLAGKFKLAQHMNEADRTGAISGLEGSDAPGSLALARAMRSEVRGR
jgi:transcriptional regulator